MRPMAAAAAGAAIAGVAMYAVGTKTAGVDAFAQPPAVVQTADGQFVAIPASGFQPVTYTPALAAAPQVVVARPAAPRPAVVTRTVTRAEAPAPVVPQRVVTEAVAPERSWKKTALVIGGTTASGAGVGAIVGGKKGALAGAAIGGGAASIYEAIRRH